MEVAGLTTPRPVVIDAALMFAARSRPNATLFSEERDALKDLVMELVENSD